MNEDRILSMFFEKARWQYAIEKGLFKDMNKAVMYQMTTPEARLAMYQRIKSGNYKIMPPHTAKIPKDNGDFRTVYVNEPVDKNPTEHSKRPLVRADARDGASTLYVIPKGYRLRACGAGSVSDNILGRGKNHRMERRLLQVLRFRAYSIH